MNCSSWSPGTLLFSAFAAVVVLLAAWAFYSAYLRRKALAELAASMGLSFSADGPDAALLAQTGLELFSLGRSRKAHNLIEERQTGAGPAISFFDYRYTTGSGKNSRTHCFTLALFACAGKGLPCFELKPENILYKLGELVGFKDIDIPSSPVFSDKYRLTGADEAAVLSFFSPEAVARLEREHGWRAEGGRNYLLLFRASGLVPKDDYSAFMLDAKALAASLVK